MEIALIAENEKKELMTQFCIAYCNVLSRSNLYTTSTLGNMIEDATGLKTEKFMSGPQGGIEQINTKVEFDEIDALIIFRNNDRIDARTSEFEDRLIRSCDAHNVPVATNIATAELVICAIDRGDLDWRDYVNPVSKYNKSKREAKK